MIDRQGTSGQTLGRRQVMDRLLEDAFVSPRTVGGQAAGQVSPPLDVYEEGDGLVVETSLPGITPEDIDITVDQGVLTIGGEIKGEEERKARNYLVSEQRIWTGRFSRSLRLPEMVDQDACQASFEHGVLRLRFPKVERARARRIQIETGG